MVLIVVANGMKTDACPMRLLEEAPPALPTTQVEPESVNIKRKRSDQGSLYMPDDGTRYDEVVGKNGRLRKVRRLL